MTRRPTLTQVNKAAVWPGEEEVLAAVVANLRNDDAKLIYADGLEERGDPRGPFLREFVAAARLSGAADRRDRLGRGTLSPWSAP